MVDMLVAYGVAIAVLAPLAARATREMNRRGLPGWMFGALVAFVPVVGLITWLVAAALTAEDAAPTG